MQITYIEKGAQHDYKRVDTVRTVYLERPWKTGGLLYGYKDRFNVMCIAMEDIVEMSE